MRGKLSIFSVTAVLALLADQLTKSWARAVLRPIYPEVKTFIAGYWEFRYSENPGAAFGLFRHVAHMHWLFDLFAIVMVVGAVVYLVRTPFAHPLRVGAELGLLVGGALGNLIDRVRFERVTDFIVWKAGSYEWHTFNVADAVLVVAVVGLLIDLRKPTTSSS
jgi:signal peptidase II